MKKDAFKVIILFSVLFLQLSVGFKFFGNSFGFKFRSLACSAFEFINGSGGINQVLLAGIERVAVGANFNMDFRFSGACGECIAASTNEFGLRVILWV